MRSKFQSHILRGFVQSFVFVKDFDTFMPIRTKLDPINASDIQ